MARRRRSPRQLRRLRSWMRHSTNAEIRSAALGSGCVVVMIAVIGYYLTK
jgi:hypothetical protein